MTTRTPSCAPCTCLDGHLNLCVSLCQSLFSMGFSGEMSAELCLLQQCPASRYDSRVEVHFLPSVPSQSCLSGLIEALHHFGWSQCLLLVSQAFLFSLFLLERLLQLDCSSSHQQLLIYIAECPIGRCEEAQGEDDEDIHYPNGAHQLDETDPTHPLLSRSDPVHAVTLHSPVGRLRYYDDLLA